MKARTHAVAPTPATNAARSRPDPANRPGIVAVPWTVAAPLVERPLAAPAPAPVAKIAQPAHQLGRISIHPPPPTGVQAKLTVSQPEDKYEQEADRVADTVMRLPDPTAAGRPEDDEDKPKPKPDIHGQSVIGQIAPLSIQKNEPSPYAADPSHLLGRLHGRGQPLPDTAREFFEPRFGHGFGRVRVHSDGEDALSARTFRARAYTIGPHIVFGAGEYSPETKRGRALLAHELVHVVQQRWHQPSQGIQRAPDGSPQQKVEEPSQAAKNSESESGNSTADTTLLSKGVSVDLDMDGDLLSKELLVDIKSDNRATIQLAFRHDEGTRTQSIIIRPKRIKVAGANLYSTGTTDGIHPLGIHLQGISKDDEKKIIFDTIFIAPGDAPGKYAVMEGREFDPGTVEAVDLGVVSTSGTLGRKIIEQIGEVRKEGGIWQIDLQVGPKREVRAALYIIKDPEDEASVLCYFAMGATKVGRTGIESPRSSAMKVSLPVTFEELDMEKHSESNKSLTFRFLPPYYERGILITYEMAPLDAANPDASNAVHGLNVYPVNTLTGQPENIIPAAKARFTQVGGYWKTRVERRTVKSFRIESAKDALEKLPQITLPKSELVALIGQMSLLAMTAVKEGIASKALFEQWVELSFGVAVYGPDAENGDETAKFWLKEKSDQFIRTLQDEIGSTGTLKKDVNAVGVGPAGGPITTTYENKYTGASHQERQVVGLAPQTPTTITELKRPFDEVRTLFAAGKYDEAIAKLRGNYYLWVEDQLLNNPSTDKETKDRLKSYGYQMSYRRQLKETLAGQTRPLQRVRALYYPDMTNIEGQNKYERKYGGVDKIVSLPLDIFYQDTGSDWVLYNFTTLTEPGKLNNFQRTWSKGPGEFAPPQEMFELLTSDEGVGTGYIHYQTEIGEGGVIRVDHPWTVGGVLIGAAVVIGLIALALTGVGALFEGAAIGGVTATGAAAMLGDIAMITALAGGTIKLVSDVAEGAPVSAGQVAGLALDVATSVLPVLRGLRTVASLRRYKGMFILLDTVANAKWAAKLELAANTTAIVVGTGKGIEELITLSRALEEGRIDEATFYWAIVRNVGLGVINVMLLRSGFESIKGRTIGNTTIDEVVQKSMARNLLDTKPTAMHTQETLEAGIGIMQESSSVYRSMVLEALSNESKLEQAVDVLCYLGKKGRGALDDVVILDGKVRRAVDVLIEGKFYGKTLPIPQGFIGSKGEALDDIPRDFAAFSKAAAEGVHGLPGLENAEVRMQGSATMGITRPKKPPAGAGEAAPAEVQAPQEAGAPAGKTWDVDLAIMLEPPDFVKRMVETFKGKVKYIDKAKGNVEIEIEKMTQAQLEELAMKINAEDVARKTARAEAEARGEKPAEMEKTYNSDAYTFANAIVTGKANPGRRWSKDIAELRDRLTKEFNLPQLDLSVIAKRSGFDSSPFLVLK